MELVLNITCPKHASNLSEIYDTLTVVYHSSKLCTRLVHRTLLVVGTYKLSTERVITIIVSV